MGRDIRFIDEGAGVRVTLRSPDDSTIFHGLFTNTLNPFLRFTQERMWGRGDSPFKGICPTRKRGRINMRPNKLNGNLSIPTLFVRHNLLEFTSCNFRRKPSNLTKIWFPPRLFSEQWRGWVISPKKWTTYFKAWAHSSLVSPFWQQCSRIFVWFLIAEMTQPPLEGQSRSYFTEQLLGGLDVNWVDWW